MNPDYKKIDPEQDLKPDYSQDNWELGDYTTSGYYEAHEYPVGPVCKVVWVVDGKVMEKEYSTRDHALEKRNSLLKKQIPAQIKPC